MIFMVENFTNTQKSHMVQQWENPAPIRMFWRPDKMIVEYEFYNA